MIVRRKRRKVLFYPQGFQVKRRKNRLTRTEYYEQELLRLYFETMAYNMNKVGEKVPYEV